MISFGLSNLRRLRDVQPLELKPLTILVGRNSSGKSTFLRSLPLLKQSISTRTSSPILWYGDWVDFGSFAGAVNKNDDNKLISFFFSISDIVVDNYIVPFWDGGPEQAHQTQSTMSFLVDICRSDSGTRISHFSLSESQNAVHFQATVTSEGKIDSLRIDDVEMISFFSGFDVKIESGSLFPDIFVSRKISSLSKTRAASFNTPYEGVHDVIVKACSSYLKAHLDKRTSEGRLASFSNQLFSLSHFDTATLQILSSRTQNRSWRKFLKRISEIQSTGEYTYLRHLYLLYHFGSFLSSFASSAKSFISRVLYIGPARARSDRFYRYQDLSVSEIDPDGKNFPMFLNSLSPHQIQRFSDWVKHLFNFGVRVEKSSGHISIELVYPTSTVNIVDTGYGVSQILPVLGQIWWAINQPRRGFGGMPVLPPFIAIEQPELHLHPAHQARLADAFIGGLYSIASDGSRTRRAQFIIETHSEALINRIGHLISRGSIDPNDVQIVVFEADSNDDQYTAVHTSLFDSEGVLLNWPYDFFIAGSDM
jgi:hypothetical protein